MAGAVGRCAQGAVRRYESVADRPAGAGDGGVKRSLLAFCVIFATSGMGRAMADDICPALTRLLTNPPAGFVALRAEKTSAVWPIWKAKAFLANAVCELRG